MNNWKMKEYVGWGGEIFGGGGQEIGSVPLSSNAQLSFVAKCEWKDGKPAFLSVT